MNTWENGITRLLRIKYPIIQAPMFGVATPEMVVAANEANCLGVLPLGDLPFDKCVEAIRATKSLTNSDFAVNIFVNEIPEVTEDLKKKYRDAKKYIEQLATQHGIETILPDIEEIEINSYHEQVDAIIAENCRIVSFTFGNLDRSSINKLKDKGVLLIGTCTSVHEALVLEETGIDILCVQGIEAGGHRGSFTDKDIPQLGGFSLLSQVYDCVKVPIIYAGGIYNARTLSAARTLGAQALQIGSLLLGSAESALKEFEKRRLRSLNEADILLCKSFSGRYARGIKNAFISAVESSGHVLPYPYQNKLTAGLRKTAKSNNNVDFVSIWVGQSINEYSGKSTTEIFKKLIADVEQNGA